MDEREVVRINYTEGLSVSASGTARPIRKVEVVFDYAALTTGFLAKLSQGGAALAVLIGLALHARPLIGDEFQLFLLAGLVAAEDLARLFCWVTKSGLAEELGIHRTTVDRAINWLNENSVVKVITLPDDFVRKWLHTQGKFTGQQVYILTADGLLRTSDIKHSEPPSETVSQNVTRPIITVSQNVTRDVAKCDSAVSQNTTLRVTKCDTNKEEELNEEEENSAVSKQEIPPTEAGDPVHAQVLTWYRQEIGIAPTPFLVEEIGRLTTRYPDLESWCAAFTRAATIETPMARWRYVVAVMQNENGHFRLEGRNNDADKISSGYRSPDAASPKAVRSNHATKRGARPPIGQWDDAEVARIQAEAERQLAELNGG